jgi:hypothetical protein
LIGFSVSSSILILSSTPPRDQITSSPSNLPTMKEASVPRTAGFFPPRLIAAAAFVFTALLFLDAATAANVSWTGAEKS